MESLFARGGLVVEVVEVVGGVLSVRDDTPGGSSIELPTNPAGPLRAERGDWLRGPIWDKTECFAPL